MLIDVFCKFTHYKCPPFLFILSRKREATLCMRCSIPYYYVYCKWMQIWTNKPFKQFKLLCYREFVLFITHATDMSTANYMYTGVIPWAYYWSWPDINLKPHARKIIGLQFVHIITLKVEYFQHLHHLTNYMTTF